MCSKYLINILTQMNQNQCHPTFFQVQQSGEGGLPQILHVGGRRRHLPRTVQEGHMQLRTAGSAQAQEWLRVDVSRGEQI